VAMPSVSGYISALVQ